MTENFSPAHTLLQKTYKSVIMKSNDYFDLFVLFFTPQRKFSQQNLEDIIK